MTRQQLREKISKIIQSYGHNIEVTEISVGDGELMAQDLFHLIDEYVADTINNIPHTYPKSRFPNKEYSELAAIGAMEMHREIKKYLCRRAGIGMMISLKNAHDDLKQVALSIFRQGGWSDYVQTYDGIISDTGYDLPRIKRLIKTLKALGYVETVNAVDDEGMMKGRGFIIVSKKLEVLDLLDELDNLLTAERRMTQ